MSASDLSQLEGINQKHGEPVFEEPWEAHAFALVVALHKKGVFEWSEWAEVLSSQIHSGDDLAYYRHWLKALETIMAERQIATAENVDEREAAWHRAAARTPHGEPIKL